MTVHTAQRSQTAETAECRCGTDTPMSVPEAASLLHCSREYLYAGLREGRFPGAQVGRYWKMPRAFVQGFIRDVLITGGQVRFEDYAAAWFTRYNTEVAI